MKLIDADALKAYIKENGYVYANTLDTFPAAEVGKWISVEDRLPKKEGEYLCATRLFSHLMSIHVLGFSKNLSKVSKYDLGDHKHAGWYSYDSEYGYYSYDDVTHWMPLPELPKEEESC